MRLVAAFPRLYGPPRASAELSRCVEKVVGYPPLSELGDLQRREFHEALLEAQEFEYLPGKWQAAILKGRREPAEAPGLLAATRFERRTWRATSAPG